MSVCVRGACLREVPHRVRGAADEAADAGAGFAVAADGCRLYYNLSGSPDAEDKVLMVMGFACCRSYWKPQVSGPHKLDDGTMQVCTFDNRGVGLSDRPLGSHTALRLARDCLAIMQHVKWLPRDEPRGLQPAPPPMSRPRIHIVGWSLGGMIAQELALMMLDRSTPAATVTFACTHSGGWRLLPPPASFPRILKLCLAMDTRSRIERVLPLHYRSAFLCQPACGTPAHLFHGHKSHEGWSDGEGTPTEQDCLIEEYKTRSPFKDSLLSYAPGLAGHLIAAARHFVSMDRLRRLGSDSRTRCLVVTAAQDSLIPAHHSRALAMAIGGSCEFVEFSENGHMVNLECFREFNAVVRHHIKRAAAGASARAGGDEEDLRRLLLNARCRRLVAVELSSAAEPWLLVHVVVGWLVRYALVIPVAMLMRLLTLLWKHAVAVRATIQHFFAVLCRYVAPSRGGGRFPGGRFHTWVFGVISKTSLGSSVLECAAPALSVITSLLSHDRPRRCACACLHVGARGRASWWS